MESIRKVLILLLAAMLLAPVGAVVADEDAGDELDESDQDESEAEDEVENEDEADEEDDEDEEDEEDEREDEMKHEVKTSISDDEIEVKLEREAADSESEIEFKLDLSEAKFKLKYEEENEVMESEQKLEVRLTRLLEFVDGDGDGAYDEGETILSSYAIGSDGDDLSGDVPENGSINWAQPSISDITSGTTSGKMVEARGSFGPGENATFGIDIMVFGDFTMLNGSQLMPTDVKIDFLILDFPYTANNSQVGLLMKTKTKQEQERENEHIDSDEDGIVASSTTDLAAVNLAFTWKSMATVDGVDEAVGTTVLRESVENEPDEFEFEQRFVLSYARGDSIVHDPVAGVAYASNPATAAGTSPAEDGDFLGMLPGFTSAMTGGGLLVAGLAATSRRTSPQ